MSSKDRRNPGGGKGRPDNALDHSGSGADSAFAAMLRKQPSRAHQAQPPAEAPAVPPSPATSDGRDEPG